MVTDGGDLENIGGSSERKGRIVGRFVGFVLGAILLVLLLVIGYLALRKEKSVPPSTNQPTKQSRALSAPTHEAKSQVAKMMLKV